MADAIHGRRRRSQGIALSLDEGLSRLIGRIYESVYEAGEWRSTMHEMMSRTESRLAFVTLTDVQHRDVSRAEFYGPETSRFEVAADEYRAGMYETDPSLLWASKNPNAGLCDTSTLMPREEFRQLPYVRWQESRMGTVHWRVFYTQPVDGLTFALSLHPPASEGPPSRATAKLHKLLCEHMASALRLAARPPDLSAASDAVIALDTSGRVLAMSPRADQLVRACDGLVVRERRLTASCPETTARLDRAIAAAVESETLGGTGGGLRLPRPCGSADWLALVSPCPRHLDHLPVRTPAAVLRILHTDAQAQLSAAHAELFDLSRREVAVADALLKGHSLDSLCALLSISRNTAKAHLQSVFRKTGTNRQSELVHLLANATRGSGGVTP